MANRHLARSIAMQTLYQWDFSERSLPEKFENMDLEEVISYNLSEFGPGLDDHEFSRELVHGVLDNVKDIDKIIVQYAPDWPLEQITNVDRNILRIGVYEMKMTETIPSRVAINEAIELAKSFGGESSGRFVNGVLGAIYNDIKESGDMKEVDLKPPKKKEDGEDEKSEVPAPEEDSSQ